MNSRERVKAAVKYKAVDKAPLQYNYTAVGYYEHGQALNDLYRSVPDDFGPFQEKPIPTLSPEQLDEHGNYHEYKLDEWGVTWEHRIYGVAGIPYIHPLADETLISSYKVPALPEIGSEEFLADKAYAEEHKKNYYLSRSAGNFMERMISLRPDAEVYCDIAEGTVEINVLAEKIMGHLEKRTRYLLATGVDAVYYGDDYGTEKTMILSPQLWRDFFKPRWKYLFDIVKKEGKNVHFHSCGYILPILEDLKEIGVDSIWPQLPAYDMQEFAKYCKDIQMAVAIHTDRANTLTFGTPQQVSDLIKKEYEVFKMQDGGSWFYVEADNGFPFENIEAMVRTIELYR